MTYQETLPRLFPFCIEVHKDKVTGIVAFLMTDDPTVSNGSSFALTSDATQNFRRLWLSAVSAKRLYQSDMRLFFNIRQELKTQEEERYYGT